jgi:hypothetical protein
MYLWKLWRESRTALSAVVLALIALFVLLISIQIRWHMQDNPPQRVMLAALAFVPFFQAIPFGFLGWALGSLGIGRDLGEGSGSYLLSRPKPRRYFVWCDWLFGIAILLTLSVALNAGLWLAAGESVADKLNWHRGSVSFIHLVCFAWASTLLFSALIFSLTYFSTVLIKHSRGILLSAGLLIGYTIAGMVIRHYWPNVEFPDLLLRTWKSSGGFADHLAESITIRALLLLLFPAAAQLLLQRTEA